MIVPEEGVLKIRTELGRLQVQPGELCVIPQNIRFAVEVNGNSRGYICEVYGTRYRLPDLGPIGANGLANPRDFLYPTAHYDETDASFIIINKYQGTSSCNDNFPGLIEVVFYSCIGNAIEIKINGAPYVS